jgi:hypothetical protein
MPSKGLHGCWNGLHGIVGFHLATAIVPLLLPHPCCHCDGRDANALHITTNY